MSAAERSRYRGKIATISCSWRPVYAAGLRGTRKGLIFPRTMGCLADYGCDFLSLCFFTVVCLGRGCAGLPWNAVFSHSKPLLFSPSLCQAETRRRALCKPQCECGNRANDTETGGCDEQGIDARGYYSIVGRNAICATTGYSQDGTKAIGQADAPGTVYSAGSFRFQYGVNDTGSECRGALSARYGASSWCCSRRTNCSSGVARWTPAGRIRKSFCSAIITRCGWHGRVFCAHSGSSIASKGVDGL